MPRARFLAAWLLLWNVFWEKRVLGEWGQEECLLQVQMPAAPLCDQGRRARKPGRGSGSPLCG